MRIVAILTVFFCFGLICIQISSAISLAGPSDERYLKTPDRIEKSGLTGEPLPKISYSRLIRGDSGILNVGTTKRVSVNSTGAQGNGVSFGSAISSDGRLVAFYSDSNNFVPDDTNSANDIFVHDMQTNNTTRVSVTSTAVEGNGGSANPSVSSDGRYIAFQSSASNLVTNDTNGRTDIFVHDMLTGNTTLVSVHSDGVQGDDKSLDPVISSDGQYIAFESSAYTLVDEYTNGVDNIYLHNLQTGNTSVVSVSSIGEVGGSDSRNPAISSDGRYIAFESDASNLVSGDTNGKVDIFVHDMQTGITTRVSVNSSGGQYFESYDPAISSDGRYIVFYSQDQPLAIRQIYIHDQQTRKTELVSVNSSGTEGNYDSYAPAITSDGRYVAFSSYSTNLIPNWTNYNMQIYLRDQQSGKIRQISVNSEGVQGDLSSNSPAISSEGRYIAFESRAGNLIDSDTNGQRDIFIHDRGVSYPPPTIESVSPSSGYTSLNATCTIVGTNFISGTMVYLSNETIISLGTINTLTSNLISCTLPTKLLTPGNYTLIVRNPDDESASYPFLVITGQNAPTILSITPTTAPNTVPIRTIITGSGFFKTGATVTLSNGTTRIPGTPSLVNKSTIICTFPLTGAPTWIYNLTVQNPDNQSATIPGVFTVTNATPTIIAINPTSAYNLSRTRFFIKGSGFRNGMAVALMNETIYLSGEIMNRTPTELICTFPLGEISGGLLNISVFNIDGTIGTKVNALTVTPIGSYPEIHNFTPNTGLNNNTVTVTINGTNFRSGAKVTITNGTVNRTAVPTFVTDVQIQCPMPLIGLPYGIYNLTALNSDGSDFTIPGAFTIMNPAPVITGITPAKAFNTSLVQVRITGTNFTSGCTVHLTNGSTIIPGIISGFAGNKFNATFSLPGHPASIYNLTVTNPGGSNSTLYHCFTSVAPGNAPIIANYSPTWGENTAAIQFTIEGTNFRPGATVTITNGTSSKTVSGTIKGDRIKCLLPLTGLPYGHYTITVKNMDGSSGTNLDIFEVRNPNPVITSISPKTGYTTGPLAIVISGSKFINGLNVTLQNGSTLLNGTVSGLTSAKCTGTFQIQTVPPGIYNLSITNPGGPNTTRLNCFIVSSPKADPTIGNFSPAFGVNTGSVSLIIDGTNFRPVLTVTIMNHSLSKTVSASVINSTRIRCTLPLKGLSYGSYNLTVRNSDGSYATLINAFQVTVPAPIITRISPVVGNNTETIMVTISGLKFESGANITLSNKTTMISGTVSTLTPTSIAGLFPLSGSPTGQYNLTVSNPGNVNGSKVKAFTIAAGGTAPLISSIDPASGFNNANMPIIIRGANFRSSSVYLNQGSVLKLASATSGRNSNNTVLYVTLPLFKLGGGLYNITIKNSDGVNTTATEVFFVTDQAWISKRTNAISPIIQIPEFQNIVQVPVVHELPRKEADHIAHY